MTFSDLSFLYPIGDGPIRLRDAAISCGYIDAAESATGSNAIERFGEMVSYTKEMLKDYYPLVNGLYTVCY